METELDIFGLSIVSEIEPLNLGATQLNFINTLVAGGFSAFAVDVAIFPIDTLKTRYQSKDGFKRSGGFRKLYKGLAPAAAGNAPTYALFVCAYENFKQLFENKMGSKNSTFINMMSASSAEMLACLIRVPVEIAKQRCQNLGHKSQYGALHILWTAYKTEGIHRGIYRGFGSTIMRDIPFSLIQFPLWEFLKTKWQPVTGLDSSPFTVALCGAVSGGISGGLTTPLDVTKTRIMLAEQNSAIHSLSIPKVLYSIYREGGVSGLFAGFVLRVTWITSASAIFFGLYDLTTKMLASDNLNCF
ncbi:S-adenosylmethionine mitochondrial carrier protein homolog [Haematobia irritans]|uniref:S-adenosylmethionine mitochondrial carrier protein homolog n=1 Tax=Haematobia irritans TaxID=7368 RepID=UPI003F4FD5C3